MGKTTLVLESIRDRDDAVYYQATRGSAEQQIRSFVSDSSARDRIAQPRDRCWTAVWRGTHRGVERTDRGSRGDGRAVRA